MKTEKILLVDDEVGILQMLEIVLKKEGYRNISTALSAKETLTSIQNETFDIIVLDVMLPDQDGFELCREIRHYTNAPILFLTARSSDLDKLTGLGIGGDDYITKPFNPLEVVARINAHIRRLKLSISLQQENQANTIFEYDKFIIYQQEGRLVVNDETIPCTAKEFELLVFLCKHPYRIFTAEQLYQQVWGSSFLGDVKTVVIHISKLRKRIENDAKNPQYIVNIRGLGYKFIPHNKRSQ